MSDSGDARHERDAPRQAGATEPMVRAHALRLLALREHSRDELARKLHHWLRRRQAAERRAGRGAGRGAGLGFDAAAAVEPELETDADGAWAAGLGVGIDPEAGPEHMDAPAIDDDDAAREARAAQEQLVDRVLDALERERLLSDERAAESLRHAAAARYGVRRLQQTLRAKALDAALVTRTLDAARPGEYERALEIWRRRFGAPPADLRERARQQRFLAARGFEGDVITRVLRAAGSPRSLDDAADD